MEHLQAVRQLFLALGSPAVHSHHQVVATFLPAEVALQADTHGPTQTDRQTDRCTHAHTHTRTHMQTHTHTCTHTHTRTYAHTRKQAKDVSGELEMVTNWPLSGGGNTTLTSET